MPESLLEVALKAKKPARKKEIFSMQEEELCMAWLSDEIKLDQVMTAMKHKAAGQTYTFLARCSRQLFLKAQPKKK